MTPVILSADPRSIIQPEPTEREERQTTSEEQIGTLAPSSEELARRQALVTQILATPPSKAGHRSPHECRLGAPGAPRGSRLAEIGTIPAARGLTLGKLQPS